MIQKKRSTISVMAGLIGMIKPLLGIMFLAILMGCIGNLMATFLTVFGSYGLLAVLGNGTGMSLKVIFICMVVFAVLRGVLRYAEQACNHYIAFKLLASIRHQVFAALRKLAPAKLDGSEKGNLISIITSDIELLEVFYAHTISPIAIACLTSIFMCIYLGTFHVIFGVAALGFYLLVGAVVPIWNGKHGKNFGQQYRDSFGKLNTTVLDNLYGVEDILQYGQEEKRRKEMAEQTERLEQVNRILKKKEQNQRILTDWILLAAGVVFALLASVLTAQGEIEAVDGIVAVVAIMSSFGPTAALSALSNNLNHTIASGNRVLNLLEEIPVVKEITDGEEFRRGEIQFTNVSFSYPKTGNEVYLEGMEEERNQEILTGFSHVFEENKIHGILGKSGCGKSTLLKLLMHFYETESGEVSYGGRNVNHINTNSLRKNISYVTQETFLFHDTIENNIKVAKEDATREEVIEAAKKASIHEFIMTLPDGYDTVLAEGGASVSGGEKQRIGIARALLHNADMIFLDEPTSNIDSLNEGIILKSLLMERKNKTILFVSHRKSTMGIAENILRM